MFIRIRRAKTGVNQWVEVVHDSVRALIRTLVSVARKGEHIFPFTPETFRKQFRQTVGDLGLHSLYSPHSLRHGGATHYLYLLNWDFVDVMRRGRWKEEKSCRHYLQEARALLLGLSVETEMAELGAMYSKKLLFHMTLPRKH